jgi:hypothetical protein
MVPPDGLAIGQYATVELTGTTGSTFTGAVIRDEPVRRAALPMASIAQSAAC